MSKKTDVLVIGSGMAGLMAALAAAGKNCEVRLISEGMGTLAISGGNIDLLGYDKTGNRLANPWDGFESLNKDHPYSLLGVEKVKAALAALCQALKARGLLLHSAKDDDGNDANFLLPTIMGTLKPTWLYQSGVDMAKIANAKKILVIGVKGFRDCRPKLIISQLRRYPGWRDREFAAIVLPEPFSERGRSLNALDLAHVVDRKQGRAWFLDVIKNRGANYDLALLPPMLGAKAASAVRDEVVEALGCQCLEMQSIPPGVSGLRIRDGLMEELLNMGVDFYENASVCKTEVKDGVCVGITASSTGRNIDHQAKAVVVATGGILSGGIIMEEGKAHEAIFNLPLSVPEDVDKWTEPEIFGEHLITRLGVKVNDSMQPMDENGKLLLKNVFFAGRTLGGYDYATEKSGHGVACATGWQAGLMAAECAAQTHNNQAGA